jgi:hypothetical protein
LVYFIVYQSLIRKTKYYIFQGQKKLVPAGWKEVNNFLKELKHVEKLQWAYSLPHERDALLNKKLIAITKDLPPNWVMIIGTTICGIILAIQVVSFGHSQISNLQIKYLIVGLP